MDVWKILGTEPTTDKRAIKRAYAAKTKVIHPEENPEAFRQLYEAYQAALGYAEFVSKGGQFSVFGMGAGIFENNTPETAAADGDTAQSGMAGGETPEADSDVTKSNMTEDAAPETEEAVSDETDEADEAEGNEELLSYFEKSQEEQKQRIEAFIKYWAEFESPYHHPEITAWWEDYLRSEEFLGIRNHPRVVHLLAEEINDKFFYGLNEVKLMFWDAYGFQEDSKDSCQGDQLRLWKCLYPAYERQQKSVRSAKWEAKYTKIKRVYMGLALAALLAVCIMVPLTQHMRRINGRLYLESYMKQRYPGIEFSEPEELENSDEGDAVYGLHPLTHPELQVTATVEYRYVEGKPAYVVEQDYNQILVEYYAMQYGIDARRVSYYGDEFGDWEETTQSVLVYPDVEQMGTFCQNAVEMFSEEELQEIPAVLIGTDQVIYPMQLLRGGMLEVPFAKRQIYDLRTMEASELETDLKEAYMIYMFQYESWNITPQQYRAWGAEYEEMCEELVDESGGWHEVYDPDTGECLCRLYIPTYEFMTGRYDAVPIYTRMITVGNAYYFLMDRGADLQVNEDGSGFGVTFYGSETEFGRDPVVEFYELKNYY